MNIIINHKPGNVSRPTGSGITTLFEPQPDPAVTVITGYYSGKLLMPTIHEGITLNGGSGLSIFNPDSRSPSFQGDEQLLTEF